jgi:hypothetical protein
MLGDIAALEDICWGCKNVRESDMAVGSFVLRSEVIYTGGIWMTAEVMCVLGRRGCHVTSAGGIQQEQEQRQVVVRVAVHRTSRAVRGPQTTRTASPTAAGRPRAPTSAVDAAAAQRSDEDGGDRDQGRKAQGSTAGCVRVVKIGGWIHFLTRYIDTTVRSASAFS